MSTTIPAPVPPALPVNIADTTVLSIYRQWHAAIVTCHTTTFGDDKLLDAFVDREIIPCEQQLVDTPATTVRDLAAKTYVLAEYEAGPFSDEIDAMIEAPSSQIETLFGQWQANSVTSDNGMSDAEREALCDEYRRLQVAIVSAVPTTAREVAMQFWCDCDSGGSDHSESFKARMRQLAGIEGGAK
jgi:hypothetical protein